MFLLRAMPLTSRGRYLVRSPASEIFIHTPEWVVILVDNLKGFSFVVKELSTIQNSEFSITSK